MEKSKFQLLMYMTRSKSVVVLQDYSKMRHSQSIYKNDQQKKKKKDVRLEVREQQELDSAGIFTLEIWKSALLGSPLTCPRSLEIECKNRKGPEKSDN